MQEHRSDASRPRARHAGPGLAAAGLAALLLALPEPARANPWRPAEARTDEQTFRDAVVFGQEGGFPLYACRGRHADGLHLGRRRSDFDACHVGYGGQEVSLHAHDLLVVGWREAASGAVPAHALDAGQSLEETSSGALGQATLYACRAAHMGGVHPGQLRADGGGCMIGFGGRSVTVPRYEVLLAEPWLGWQPATPHALPTLAIAGGTEGGAPLFVCRAADREGLRPGKVRRDGSGCNVASEGREIVVTRFEVLVPRLARAATGMLPIGAVPAGRENGAPQYPCRVFAAGTTQLGKSGPGLSGCHIGMQGREVIVRDFEVLSR